MSSLAAEQAAFALDLARLLLHFAAAEPTWRLRPVEQGVQQYRPSTHGGPLTFMDVVHMGNSLHYLGLAADLNLDIDGVWINRGDHPAWAKIHAFWRALSDFNRVMPGTKDANHVSRNPFPNDARI